MDQAEKDILASSTLTKVDAQENAIARERNDELTGLRNPSLLRAVGEVSTERLAGIASSSGGISAMPIPTGSMLPETFVSLSSQNPSPANGGVPTTLQADTAVEAGVDPILAAQIAELESRLAVLRAQARAQAQGNAQSGVAGTGEGEGEREGEGVPAIGLQPLPGPGIAASRRQALAVAPVLHKQPQTQSQAQAPSDIVNLDRYAHLVMQGQTDAERLEGTTGIRKMLSASTPPIGDVIKSGVIPHLVGLLKRDDNPELQIEAERSLTQVTSGSNAHQTALVRAGAVPAFIRLLASHHEEVVQNAIIALGNIADSPVLRDRLLQEGALGSLLTVFQPTAKLSVLRCTAWTLSKLCGGKPDPDFTVVREALPTLAAMFNHSDSEIVRDSLRALSCLSRGSDLSVQAILDIGIVPKIVDLLAHESKEVITPALEIVADILAGDDLQAQAVLDAGVLNHLMRLLQAPAYKLRMTAVFAVSNIMAGTQAQVQQVLDAHILPILVKLIQQGGSDAKEAAWAVYNCTVGGTPHQIGLMVQGGILRPLVLLAMKQDPAFKGLAAKILSAFGNILKAGIVDQNMPAAYSLFVQPCVVAGVPGLLHYLRTYTMEEAEKHRDMLALVDHIEDTYFRGRFMHGRAGAGDANGWNEEEGEEGEDSDHE